MSSELPINDDTAANERSQSGSRFDETARPNDEGFQARGGYRMGNANQGGRGGRSGGAGRSNGRAAGYFPQRTFSAPPDEGIMTGVARKPSFVPTKSRGDILKEGEGHPRRADDDRSPSSDKRTSPSTRSPSEPTESLLPPPIDKTSPRQPPVSTSPQEPQRVSSVPIMAPLAMPPPAMGPQGQQGFPPPYTASRYPSNGQPVFSAMHGRGHPSYGGPPYGGNGPIIPAAYNNPAAMGYPQQQRGPQGYMAPYPVDPYGAHQPYGVDPRRLQVQYPPQYPQQGYVPNQYMPRGIPAPRGVYVQPPMVPVPNPDNMYPMNAAQPLQQAYPKLEKKAIVIKDKNGNVIDAKGLAGKSNPPPPPPRPPITPPQNHPRTSPSQSHRSITPPRLQRPITPPQNGSPIKAIKITEAASESKPTVAVAEEQVVTVEPAPLAAPLLESSAAEAVTVVAGEGSTQGFTVAEEDADDWDKVDEWEVAELPAIIAADASPLRTQEQSGPNPFEDEDALDTASPIYNARSGPNLGKKTLKKIQLSLKDGEAGSVLEAYEASPIAPVNVPADNAMDAAKEELSEESKPMRSLRPGGGKGTAKVTVGEAARVYSKTDIYSYLPSGHLGTRPDCLSIYDSLTLEPYRRLAPLQSNSSATSNPPYTPGDTRRKSFNTSSQQSPQQPQGQSPAQIEDWKRTRIDRERDQGQRGRKPPAGPMPKKVISDPAEKLSREVQDILNKITPQTFEKLSAKLCELTIDTNELLDLMIHKVFEKAVQEPSFANLYAGMCCTLEEKSTQWAFFQVVYLKDSNNHIWMNMTPIDEMVAGPFKLIKECLAAADGTTKPELQPRPGKLELFRNHVIGDCFIQIFKLAGQPESEDLYMTCKPFSEVEVTSRSDNYFPTEDAARADGAKKNGFRFRLVTVCQEDFMAALQDEGIYSGVVQARAQLEAQAADMSEDDKAGTLADIELLEIKLKRRKLGTTRFIGELCKKNLVKANVMFSCIYILIGGPNDWHETSSCNEQHIELLCKLLHTVGALLDGGKTAKLKSEMTALFNRLAVLAVDKRLPTRARFSIQEVIELRSNDWQERRVQEGPALLADIHMKAAQEEYEQQKQQQMMNKNQRFYGQSSGRQQPSMNRDPRSVPGPGYGGGRHDGRAMAPVNPRIVMPSPRDANKQVNFKEPLSQIKVMEVISPVSTEEPSPVVKTPVDEDKLRRRAKTIIDEYIINSSIEESIDSMEELPSVACGFLFTAILDKFLNTNKTKEKTCLAELLEGLIPQFFMQQSEVLLSALGAFDPFVALSETILDVKEAPEIIGELCVLLIRHDAVTKADLLSLIEKTKMVASADEFCLPDQVNEAYGRVVQALGS